MTEEQRKRVNRNKAQGRKVQSKFAKMLGGKSVGTIEGQDIEHSLFSGETKHRKKFIGNTFMDQAVKNCPEGKTPLVIIHTLNQRFKNSLVMMKYSDWEEWFGKLALKNTNNHFGTHLIDQEATMGKKPAKKVSKKAPKKVAAPKKTGK